MSNLNKYEKLLYKHNRLKRHCGNQMNKIVEYKQELQRKDNEINDLKSSIADYQEAVGDYQDELKRKDNNWNELKEFILNHYIVGHKVQNSSLDMIINKMKELENSGSNE